VYAYNAPSIDCRHTISRILPPTLNPLVFMVAGLRFEEGSSGSDKPSDNYARQRLTEHDAPRHCNPSDLR
jgi:hypothetical protein